MHGCWSWGDWDHVGLAQGWLEGEGRRQGLGKGNGSEVGKIGSGRWGRGWGSEGVPWEGEQASERVEGDETAGEKERGSDHGSRSCFWGFGIGCSSGLWQV
jgi:hypothetical protein